MTTHNGFDIPGRLAALESEMRLAVQQLLDWAAQLDVADEDWRAGFGSPRISTALRKRAAQLQRAVDTAGRLEVSERGRVLVKSRPEINIVAAADDAHQCQRQHRQQRCGETCPDSCAAGPGRTERCECCGVSALARDLVYDATGWRCRRTGECTDRVLAAANVGEAI